MILYYIINMFSCILLSPWFTGDSVQWQHVSSGLQGQERLSKGLVCVLNNPIVIANKQPSPQHTIMSTFDL